MAKNSRIHGSIFAKEIALRVHLLDVFDESLQSPLQGDGSPRSRASTGSSEPLEGGTDLLTPLDAHLFRIIETPRVGWIGGGFIRVK